MKEKNDVTDYANLITKALPKGILLNTFADDRFNSMVIGWGHLASLYCSYGEICSCFFVCPFPVYKLHTAVYR